MFLGALLTPFLILRDRMYIITSESMVPTLNVGDLVITEKRDAKDIKANEKDGDIIVLKGAKYFYDHGFEPVYWNNLDGDIPIIHRAIDKKKIDGTWYFLTKGDNKIVADGGVNLINGSMEDDYFLMEYNKSDAIYVPESEILGVVVIVVPYAGYIGMYFPVIVIISIVILGIYLLFKKKGWKIKILSVSEKVKG